MRVYGIIVAMAIFSLGLIAFFWFGRFDISADTKHWVLTERVIEAIRDRSLEHASSEIDAPENLDEKTYYVQGAGDYQTMCSSCHLSPGKTKSELRMGLYPKPPDFTDTYPIKPEKAFWIVKHGLKMTGMPAWGKSHSDQAIWKMVAFIQQLPDMDESTYLSLVDQYGGSHNHDGDAHHDDHTH